MSWHAAPITLDNLDDLPKRCRRCVFWELSETLGRQAVDFGSVELEKEAWVSEILLEWGSCGRIVHVDGAPAGFVMYAPPSAVPRAAEMPTGPVSADAVLLTTMQVMPEFAGEGLGRMLAQAVVRDLTRRGVKAVEAFGEALAGLIQRELLTRTGMADCRTQGRTWELLRLTRMPAVRIELGYLSNLGDRRKLLSPDFRDVVAEGILVAVKRLYLLGQNDQPTGTFTFSDVLARELERGGAQAI